MKVVDFKQFKRVYFGNATATRDQRIQLRGSKAAVLFTIYLILMAMVLFMAYDSALGSAGSSLATAQRSLQSFYYTTLGCLGTVVTIVAPAVGAFAIVTEKQRRSLDLVFSAPVEPKYYLVGKLISAYRYVWLLLILALPFCAVSVTLGGTTWVQLFITFLLFSFYGLVCVAFGLLFSTMCAKPIPALCWTYVAIGAYWFFNATFVGLTSTFGPSPFSSMSPLSTLSPITFPFQGGQSSPIFGLMVPLWLFSVALHLLVVKIIILGAGSLLAPSDGREIRSLRLHALLYFFAVAMILGSTGGTVIASGSYVVDDLGKLFGRLLGGYLLLVGICLVPFLSAFGDTQFRRLRFNGLFKPRHLFDGTVAGNLPFLLLMSTVGVIGSVVGATLFQGSARVTPFSSTATATVNPGYFLLSFWFWIYLAHALSLWLVMWVTGMICSARTRDISRSRTWSLFSMVGLLLIPTFFSSIVAPEDLSTASGVWALNPLTGLFCSPEAASIVVVHTVVVFGVIIVAILKLKSLLSNQPQVTHP